MTKPTPPMTFDASAGPSRRHLVLGAAAAAASAALPGAAQAQSAWPNRPVRVVVPFPPGGLTDAYARMYCEFFARKFGQAFNIENKTGAGGTLGAGDVAKAAPDGYTLMITTSTPVWHGKVLYKKLNYTAVKDFEPIALIPSGALLVAVNPNVPVKTMRELVAYAHSNPVAWGSYGAGSWAHMMGDALNKGEKLSMVIAHYRGEAPMMVDLIGGQIQVGVGSPHGMMPHILKGTLRPIGATGRVRTPKLPDLPTVVEQGFTAPAFGLEGFVPFVAPAGTPREIIDKLADAMREGSATPQIKALREQFGIPNVPVTNAADVRRSWDQDSATWINLATEMGITLD